MTPTQSVVMIGATGAVGRHAATTLIAMPDVERLTLLGRRPLDVPADPRVHQHVVDLRDVATYRDHLTDHAAAICTLGVGEPSKVTREHFVQIDRDVPLAFAAACKAAGVSQFSLLSSVGVGATSRSFFLRTKGELEDGLRALDFERLSLFHPSMILTPTNRYGWQQAVTLAVWPRISPLLAGPLRKFRGVRVEQLGQAIARSIRRPRNGVEILEWDDFQGG